MCNSKPKSPMAQIDGRPVLQPASNRISINPNCQTPRQKSPKKIDNRKEIKTTVGFHKVSPPISPKPVTPKSDGLKKKAKLILNGGNEVHIPGTIAIEYRQKGSLTNGERKIRVAHYGRVGSIKNATLDLESNASDVKEEKRCSFITPNSGNAYYFNKKQKKKKSYMDDKMMN